MNTQEHTSAVNTNEATQATMLDSVLRLARQQLPGDISPAVFCLTEDSQMFVVHAADGLSHEQKPFFINTMQKLVRDKKVKLSCFVCEAWLAPSSEQVAEAPPSGLLDDWEAPDDYVAPSQHPQRQDTLLVVFQTPDSINCHTYSLADRTLGDGNLITDGDSSSHMLTSFDFFKLVREDSSKESLVA